MKTAVIIACICNAKPTDWNTLINAIPDICWGVLALLALLIVLVTLVKPILLNFYELKLQKQKLAEETNFTNLQSELRKQNKELVEENNKLKEQIAFSKLPKEEETCQELLVKANEEIKNLQEEKEKLIEEKRNLEIKSLEEIIKGYKELIKNTAYANNRKTHYPTYPTP